MKETKRLDKKLMLYSAAVVGATCVTGGAAEAVVQDFNFSPTGYTGTGLDAFLLSFDLSGNVITNPPSNSGGPNDQFRFYNNSSGPFYNMSIRGVPSGAAVAVTPANHKHAARFAYSHPIAPYNQVWASRAKLGGNFDGFKAGYGSWAPGDTGYIGLRFDDAGTPLYGWAEIGMNAYDSVTLYEYAYADPGYELGAGHLTETPIVPEPSTLALLAVGAAGLAALRRRRRAA